MIEFNPFPVIFSNNEKEISLCFEKLYEHCKEFDTKMSECTNSKQFTYEMDFSHNNITFLGKILKSIFVRAQIGNLMSTQSWTFSMDSREENYVICKSRTLRPAKFPFPYLDGNQCELREIYTGSNAPLLQDPQWDDWKTKRASSIQHYREIIYPIFQRAFANLELKNYSVLDIGGGDGELAFSLLDRSPQIDAYTLIEGNQKAVELAQQRKLHSKQEKLQVTRADITKVDGFKPADVILLSGIIAYEVLSKEASQTLLEVCKKSLMPQGIVLIASHSPCYFGASDFKKMGWDVLNKSYSYAVDSEEKEFGLEPFYVLRDTK